MLTINSQGIVLRSTRYKENDLILTLFTRKYGRVSAISRGAQRQKSRLLPISQIFSYNSYILKKNGNIFSISQGDSIKSFFNISSDIEGFSYASFIVKLVENNIIEGQPNNRLFELLVQTLFLLSEDYGDKMYIFDIFVLKFVDFLGYRPQVFSCTRCGGNDLDFSVFSVEEGGLVCRDCIDKEEFFIKLDKTTISLMQYILNNDIILCSKAEVSKILVRELFKVLKMYIRYHFDNVNFKSLDILKSI